MARLRCPLCRQEFDSDRSPALPFCSQRCRNIDLRRWLLEENSVAVPRAEDEEGPAED